MEGGTIRVRRQVARINGQITEAPLKTKNSYRTLPLAEGTVAVLKEQKKKAGNSPWVFPSPTGGPMSPDSVLHMLHRVLKRAGLPKVRFHDLRHSCATIMLYLGYHLKDIQTWLGHSNYSFTADTYIHSAPQAHLQMADSYSQKLAELLPFSEAGEG